MKYENLAIYKSAMDFCVYMETIVKGIKGKIDYVSILHKSMLSEEDNVTKKDVPDIGTLQVKLAELETKNKVLESYKTFLQEHMVLKEKTPQLKMSQT